jgi:peptide/nickel transport system substrate-binding protein
MASAASARGLDRLPQGGVLRLALPLSIDELDPHVTDDPASALFCAALVDPLYASDARGRPYAALADSLPVPTGATTLRIELRPGLVTASGKPLTAKDVLASLARARRGAAGPLLAPFGKPRAVPGAPLAVEFDGRDGAALAWALSSPATAIVPARFDPRDPDGTGAFRATRTPNGFGLLRNERAARGPAFLDRIDVARSPDLGSALRAFEAGSLDVGFLGAGLHRKRQGSMTLQTAPAGFVILRTGGPLRAWGAPGVAARLVEGIPRDRFAHLGLVPPGGGVTGRDNDGWGGPTTELLVDAGVPYLVEIARVAAAELSRPGHEVTILPLPRKELRRRIAVDAYGLSLDFVRTLGPTPRHTLLALLHAGDPALAERPPSLDVVEPHALSRTLPLAVLGDFSMRGAAVTAFQGLGDWDLGAVWFAT